MTIRLSVSSHFVNKDNRAPMRDGANRYAFGAFQTVSWQDETIAQHVGRGKAICVAALQKDWRKEENFQSAQLMGVDFDHGPDVDALLENDLIQESAFLVYRTPNWTLEAPRTRALFILDTPITVIADYKRLLKRLLYWYDVANIDDACKDAVRIFFGSTQTGACVRPMHRLPIATLEALKMHPDELPKPPQAPRQAVAPQDATRAEKYALATREGIINEALSTPSGAGLRHTAFNAMVMKLIAREDWPHFNTIDSEIENVGRQMGRDPDEITRSIRGARASVERMPLALPNDTALKTAIAVQVPTQDTKTPQNAPQAADKPITWHTSDDSMARYKERLTTASKHGRTPLVFPFRVLHKAGGFCRAVPPGILIGVVGLSGGLKTSFVETITDKWRQIGPNHVLWWGPEWSWEKMADRAIQRYSHVNLTDMMLHEMWLSEEAQDIPPAKRYGARLRDDVIDHANRTTDMIAAWPGKSHYIDQMDLDITELLAAASQRVKDMEAAGIILRIAVFDYLQLMNMRSVRSEMDRITQVLGLVKAFCVDHQLIGVVASQVTKATGRESRSGDATLDAESGQFLRSDKFNLVLTLNPTYEGKMLTGNGIIRVAKNSAGIPNFEKRVVLNPARFLWEDKEALISPSDEPRTNIEF